MKSKWASQFPIYEQIGISILRDIPLDKVDPYWKDHYLHLRVFYKNYKLFMKTYRSSDNFSNKWCEFITRKRGGKV